MDFRVRASPEQLATLLEYMESHGDLARPLAGAQGRIRSDRLWSDLTNILNSMGGGVSKTTEKWKKVWADWKSKTKKKALTIKRHAGRTGGGPASRQTLSAIDERVLAILGPLAVEGQASVEELGFNIPQSPAPVSLPVAHNDPVHLEVIDDTSQPPSSISPQPSTSQPSNSWLRPSTSQSPAPLVVAPPLSEGGPPVPPDRPAAPATPAAPAPPAPPALATPEPRRRLPARRRLRSTTPASPQSAASPRRPRVGARRRLAPTPFERAASEFSAVELRRLELEDTRARQQHERELRALEVEHERNIVFSSVVEILQSWFDYYRSRENTEPLNTE